MNEEQNESQPLNGLKRVHDIVFYGSKAFSETVPRHVLDQVPDEKGMSFKANLFDPSNTKKLSNPCSVEEARKSGSEMYQQAAACFPINSIWSNKNFERKFFEFAATHKFGVSTNKGVYYNCSKAGFKRKTQTSENNAANTMKCDCQFKLQVTYLYTFPKIKGESNRKSWRNNEEKKKALLMVTSLPDTNHNHPCDNTTYHMTLNRSGFFANAMDPSLVYMLLGLYRKKPTLPASMLRPLLETTNLRACASEASQRGGGFVRSVQILIKNETSKLIELKFIHSFIEQYYNSNK